MDNDVAVNLRLPSTLVDRIDALAAEYNATVRLGARTSRAALIRAVLDEHVPGAPALHAVRARTRTRPVA